MENKLMNGSDAKKSRFSSICMDCVFWYQCRKGEIDCNVRPVKVMDNVVRA
ncbi:hypothetical protein [Methanooceanicella nereidis]|uniref:hypothetical protein n=1 Tax=Methanooceanicella nereidis TaxID=2052831 RepID=UPI001E304AEE|nr:hypothetical protein [Methanocella sp. CWC-04]